MIPVFRKFLGNLNINCHWQEDTKALTGSDRVLFIANRHKRVPRRLSDISNPDGEDTVSVMAVALTCLALILKSRFPIAAGRYRPKMDRNNSRATATSAISKIIRRTFGGLGQTAY